MLRGTARRSYNAINLFKLLMFFGVAAALALSCLPGCAEKSCRRREPHVVNRSAARNPAEKTDQPVEGRCPITGQTCGDELRMEVDGKVYVFCCQECVEEFQAYLAAQRKDKDRHPAKK